MLGSTCAFSQREHSWGYRGGAFVLHLILLITILTTAATASGHFASLPSFSSANSDNPVLAAAIAARDSANVHKLQRLVKTQAQRKENGSVKKLLIVSLLNHWLVEAARAGSDGDVAGSAASAGVVAAKKAAKLDPNSSDAHALLGITLQDAIPYRFLGGMRFGSESRDELIKAIHLDSDNFMAYLGLGVGKIFTPSMFGGSLKKASELLQRAISLKPNVDTPYIWLSKVFKQQKAQRKACKELSVAVRLNPNREWSRHLQNKWACKIHRSSTEKTSG